MASANTMWEFSWLVRRTGDEAEYADWPRVLDELVERGYDTVRIDAFPHLVAAAADGSTQGAFTVLPQGPRFSWGNHTPVEVEPVAALVAFVRLCREKGLKVALSGWFNDDTTHRRLQIVTPDDYVRIWTETLELLDGEGLLDAVAWVDLCNEFPLDPWAPGAYPRVMGASWPNLAPLVRRWSEASRQEMHAYFRATETLRARWDLPYTWSVQGLLGASSWRHLDLAGLDLIETHVWVSNDVRFNFRSGQTWVLLETPGSHELHRWLAPRVWRYWRDRWLDKLGQRMDAWVRCAEASNLPLATTEGWASTNYIDAPHSAGQEWDWVKDACGEAVAMACDRGWSSICTSNFCQPHFPGMWRDVAWHREMTDRIRSS